MLRNVVKLGCSRWGLLAALLWAQSPALSHELFLKPERFVLQPNSKETLTVVNGTFDQSLAIFARNRMREVSILADGQLRHPPESDWHDTSTASHLRFDTGSGGTYLAGVSSRSGVRTQTADDFRSFLKLYGALDGLDAYEKDGAMPSVRLRSSKHVKAVVQVGNSYSADFGKQLGHPVEIVLERNPYQLKLGDSLAFQVLHQGKPVAGHWVYANHAGFNEDDNAPKRVNTQKLRTDSQGRASVTLSKHAPWYIALIHVHRVNDGAADYEATWATLSFELKP